MKFRRIAPVVHLALGVCLLAGLSACSLFHRRRAETAAAAKPGTSSQRANSRGLQLDLRVTPDPVKLGEVREILVSLTVRNVSKAPVTLKFPTTQILEISLRDVATGAVVSKWSTDRSFTDDSRIISVNRGERLEYSEPITTRELKPGKFYNLEVVFLGYENELSAKKVLIPQP